MLRRAIVVFLAFSPIQLVKAEECRDLAVQIGRDYDKYADASQVETIKKANLCSAHYETATSEQRAQIEASYSLFSGGASGSSTQIKSLQDQKCEDKFDGYWSSRVTASELNRVSSVGADVVRDCLGQKSFRLVDFKTSGDAISAVFRYGGLDQIVLNGIVVAPSTMAQCSALYGGATHSDVAHIAGATLKPNETFTLVCNRTFKTVATNQKFYEGGVLGVSTNSDSPMLPVIEYYNPIISAQAANQLQSQADTLAKSIVAITGRINNASLECQDTLETPGQSATCAAGWWVTGCSAGSNFGSHHVQNNQTTCHTDQQGGWTIAHCCHLKLP